MTDILCDIFCRCYPRFRMSEERFRQLMINDSVHFLTHAGDGETAGFEIIENSALRLICVKPGYQRRGIGSKLLEEAERYAAGKGFEKLVTGGQVCPAASGRCCGSETGALPSR